MKYIRTKDGRIIDIESFINKEKENPYYSDYEFEEIKNDGDTCVISWTAIGTKENSQKDQVGRRCCFGATIDSPFIKQADTIEKLCDRYLVYVSSTDDLFVYKRLSLAKQVIEDLPLGTYIYGAIIVFGSNHEPIIKAITKPLNEKGELELL